MRISTIPSFLALAVCLSGGVARSQVDRWLAPRDFEVQPVQAPVPAPTTTPPAAPRTAVTPAPRPTPPAPAATPPGTAAPVATTAPAVAPANNPEVASSAATLFGDGPAPSGGLFDRSGFSRGANPTMIGDQQTVALRQRVQALAVPSLPKPFPPGTPPPPPSPRVLSALVPAVRGFKIAENQSPQPQDRVFFSFNYFTDLNGTVNRKFEAPVNNIRAYRYIGGFEKTFDDGRGSFGLRAPINQITANPAISGNFAKPGGTSTGLGDLSLFAKYVLKSDPKTGSLISAGLELTLPTGPSSFASANFLQGLHSTQIQPFIGYLWIRDRFYFHGFTAISTPSSVRDVTLVYNDFGVGYAVYRADDPKSFISAVTPTFEVHINNPLTHRNPFDSTDLAGSADVVDLTLGTSVSLGSNSVASFGFVKPVTSPKPFDYEVIFLLNYRFGRTRPTAALPILGG